MAAKKAILKDDLITIRIDSKSKNALMRMAAEQDRSLSNFLQRILNQIAEKKIIISK